MEIQVPSYGVVKVEQNGLWALKHYTTNCFFTDFVYDSIGDFDYFNYVIAERNHCFGILKYDGTEVIPCVYCSIRKLHADLFIVEDKSHFYGVIDLSGEFLIPCKFSKIQVISGHGRFVNRLAVTRIEDKKVALYSAHGRQITEFIYNKIEPCEFINSGFYYVNMQKGESRGCNEGLIDFWGNEIVPCIYESYGKSFYRIKPVCDYSYFEIAGGVYDNRGNFIVPCEKGDIEFHDYGIIRKLYNYAGKYGTYIYTLYDYSGNILCEHIIDIIGTWENGLLEVTGINRNNYYVNKEGCYCVYDKDELIIIPKEYEFPELLEDGSIMVVVKIKSTSSRNKTIIDRSGKRLIPQEFWHISCFSSTNKIYLGINDTNDYCRHTYILFKYNSELGVCEQMNEKPYTQFNRDEWHKNYIKVSYGEGLYGLINSEGEQILPISYRAIKANKRFLSLETSKYYEIYDKWKGVLLEGKFEDVILRDSPWRSMYDKYDPSFISFVVKDNNGWGLRNDEGEKVGEQNYSHLRFENVIYCFRGENYADVYSYKGHFLRKASSSELDSLDVPDVDSDDSAWLRVCEQEAQDIYENGGDWILD